MNVFDNITVVIPSLDPDEKLKTVVDGLIKHGFEDIVIVNDGSRAENAFRFEELSVLSQCTVLTHDKNRGKGAALKTAFGYILKSRPDCIGVITADGDNQHHPDDIARLACALQKNDEGALILGARDFSQSGIPFRSRLGNRAASLILSAVCHRQITDTQTGLRAIPACRLKQISALEGERFEFETNMLLALHSLNIPLRDVKIRTIYIDDNQTSHFRAFSDTLRIIRPIAAFSLSSLCCAAADIGIYWLMIRLLFSLPLRQRTFAATVVSRILSSVMNYILNRSAVFGAKGPVSRSLVRYYILCIGQLLCSWAGTFGLTLIIGGSSVLSKLIVDTLLFFISFFIQRRWVFAAPKNTACVKG